MKPLHGYDEFYVSKKNRTEWHSGVWTPNSPEVRLFAMIAYIEEKEEPDPAMSCCPRCLEQLS